MCPWGESKLNMLSHHYRLNIMNTHSIKMCKTYLSRFIWNPRSFSIFSPITRTILFISFTIDLVFWELHFNRVLSFITKQKNRNGHSYSMNQTCLKNWVIVGIPNSNGHVMTQDDLTMRKSKLMMQFYNFA